MIYIDMLGKENEIKCLAFIEHTSESLRNLVW